MKTVIQCWDDGVASDRRLADILRRHHATATFNLNAGLNPPQRELGWHYQGHEVWRLGWDEMRDVYDGFTIANHSLSHPHLEELPPDQLICEITEGRKKLQQFFQQPVDGFVYPFGTYNANVIQAVQEVGHLYARTTIESAHPYPPENPMEFHPTCHFLAPDFLTRYGNTRDGVFYFWGHSYELINDQMWDQFETVIQHISADPESTWGSIPALFA